MSTGSYETFQSLTDLTAVESPSVVLTSWNFSKSQNFTVLSKQNINKWDMKHTHTHTHKHTHKCSQPQLRLWTDWDYEHFLGFENCENKKKNHLMRFLLHSKRTSHKVKYSMVLFSFLLFLYAVNAEKATIWKVHVPYDLITDCWMNSCCFFLKERERERECVHICLFLLCTYCAGTFPFKQTPEWMYFTVTVTWT